LNPKFCKLSPIALIFISTALFASSSAVIVKEVLSVPRPDTLIVNVSIWPDLFGKEIPVVLDGVLIPKLNGKCSEERRLAEKALDFVKEQVKNAVNVSLHQMKRDRFFKIRAEVFVNDHSLQEAMLKAGFAVPQKTLQPWCTANESISLD